MIWYVEDDPGIRDLVIYTLNATGFETRSFETGDECWKALQSGMPELLLLDGMLPGMDGVELLQKMKQDSCLREIPVIMASARGAEFDKIRSLDLGADDYLVKPFALEELLARVRVLLRRNTGHVSNIFTLADLRVDCDSRRVFRGDRKITLSSKEFAILEYLIRNQNIVLSREKIEQHVWNYDYAGGSTLVDVYIRALRKKLDADYPNKLIHTVRGAGYVLREGL